MQAERLFVDIEAMYSSKMVKVGGTNLDDIFIMCLKFLW